MPAGSSSPRTRQGLIDNRNDGLAQDLLPPTSPRLGSRSARSAGRPRHSPPCGASHRSGLVRCRIAWDDATSSPHDGGTGPGSRSRRTRHRPRNLDHRSRPPGTRHGREVPDAHRAGQRSGSCPGACASGRGIPTLTGSGLCSRCRLVRDRSGSPWFRGGDPRGRHPHSRIGGHGRVLLRETRQEAPVERWRLHALSLGARRWRWRPGAPTTGEVRGGRRRARAARRCRFGVADRVPVRSAVPRPHLRGAAPVAPWARRRRADPPRHRPGRR